MWKDVDSMAIEFKLDAFVPASQESSPSRVPLVEDLATSGVAPASHHVTPTVLVPFKVSVPA